EGDNFKDDLKIKHVLKIYSYFYPTWDQSLADELINIYQLNKQSKVKTLSKGMESALGIIVGLASKAPITIFDEPYLGLDAAARKQSYDILIEEYETEKRTIIFSTHISDEASLLSEEVLILQAGKIVLHEEAESWRDQTCAITGPENEVAKCIENKKVVQEILVARMMDAYIYGDTEEAKHAGCNVEGMTSDELIIYLTQNKEGV